MRQKIHSEKLSRRRFLKSAAVAGGAATLTALPQVQAGVDDPSRAEKKEAAPSKGYHETPHIREYYQKARF